MDKAPARFKAPRPLAAIVALGLGPLAATPGTAAPPTAIFAFELDDTSIQGAGAADQARLRRLDTQLRDALARSGRYAPIDISALATQVAAQTLRGCDTCATALARQAGATVAVNGWVQKVSNLILNLNLVIRDVASGAVLAAGSADIRGDTDESWSRGLAWLLRHRILVDAPP